MFHFIIGVFLSAGFFILRDFLKNREIVVNWWQWLLTVLGLFYGALVLEVIYGFSLEGEGQAALVIGLIGILFAVVWGVLLGRFVFSKKLK